MQYCYANGKSMKECTLHTNKNEVAIGFLRRQEYELQELSIYWLCWTIKGQDKKDDSQ